MYPRVFRAVAVTFAASAIAGAAVAVPAQAEPGRAPATVAAITDHLAQRLAPALATGALAADASDGAVTLAAVPRGSSLGEAIRQADRAVLAAKGLPADGPSLLRLRLADPGMRAALSRGERPLVAAAWTDDLGTTVTAYDAAGKKVVLDARRVPSRPVFVVDVDTEKALPLGLEVIEETLARHGMAAPQVAATSGYWATQVRAVRLSDDKEPWIKGGAEIFGITGGFGLDGKVKVDTVTMPYLDHDGTTYYPNQLIVHFSAYKYNLADFVMMEDDGDTNYQALATALVNALLTIVDGGAYVPLVNAILEAIPASWWTDDPDYVDSWYTLSTQSAGRFNGAAANGWMDLAQYWVAPL
ncbi:DUF3103 family protein [Actinophytocola sp. KF-1]